MMVKNESKRLHVSLESVVGVASSIVLYDTGSTDNTIEIARAFCEKHQIPLRLKQGTFVDFSTSRNVSLEFADTFEDIDYLLLLDCNDELRGGAALLDFCKRFKGEPNSGFLLCQHWYSGTDDRYFNVRLVKARCGWRYRGSVHEWIKDTNSPTSEPLHPIVRASEDIVLFQDRTKDDDKSQKRFQRDKELLLLDYKRDPTETRTVFYLAQTCSCLQHHEDAFYYSRLRTNMEGFQEEKFHSYMRCGTESVELKHDWYDSMTWFLKAYEHSNRVEPLLKIAEYYKNKGLWHVASMYAERACELPYPTECILFVNKLDYDYNRWHMMGIIGFYAKKFELGKIACQKAIEYGKNKELDASNLKFYEKVLHGTSAGSPSGGVGGVAEGGGGVETRKEFTQRSIVEMKNKFPGLTPAQLERKVDMLWKLQKKGLTKAK